eukprot:SAG31_NODE_3633_length_4043_cov_5.462982_1_plen_117_part_00
MRCGISGESKGCAGAAAAGRWRAGGGAADGLRAAERGVLRLERGGAERGGDGRRLAGDGRGWGRRVGLRLWLAALSRRRPPARDRPPPPGRRRVLQAQSTTYSKLYSSIGTHSVVR